jgi:hypothetical protein
MPGRTMNGLAPESSRKRARRDHVENGEGDEVVEVQQARSNLRTEPVSCKYCATFLLFNFSES